MPKCYQCGRPAVQGYEQDDGSVVPLCIDCTLKLHQVIAMRHQMLAETLNFTADMFNAQVGMPIAPKMKIHPTPIVQTGAVTLNNISVSHSNIGVLNTGNVETIDSAIGFLAESAEQPTADALKALTEAVIQSADATKEAKNELLELFSLVSTEAAAPKQKRKSVAMGPIIDRIANICRGLENLSKLWLQYGSTILAHFGLNT